MIKLQGFTQNYDWGKIGKESLVAQLSISNKDVLNNETKPFAELWMGTHDKGPAKMENGELLSKWLAQNPKVLGENLDNDSKNASKIQLPFLFKVLSINEALSIQVHPSKNQAVLLHSTDPKNYPDNNHKPEMAIALTEFEMMCSFRPAAEILNFIHDNPELKKLIKEESLEKFSNAHQRCIDQDQDLIHGLKLIYSDLMHHPNDLVHEAARELSRRYTKFNSLEQPFELFLRLNKNFPGDVGCFSVFFLNYLKLKPGEAVFLGPNEPHSYLSGDCIECMACSDNTVRAGLTPKFKDVENLLKMLTYSMKEPNDIRFKPEKINDDLIEYKPPVPEFVVHKIEVQNGLAFEIPSLEVCSIAICIDGMAKIKLSQGDEKSIDKIGKGSIFLIPANQTLFLDLEQQPLLIFRAFCDEKL